MGGWRGKFANCTHVSKNWKETVVWIECHDAVFSRRYALDIVKISKFCKQSGKLDYSRYFH